MRWLAVGGFGLLALLLPLVLLYVLKVRRPRRRVASTWLWSAVQRELSARSPFKRLVPQLPLFLQLLALTAFAIGAARPATSGKVTQGEHIAILLDTSASMGARDEGKLRIDEAKRVAHELIDGLAPGTEALILDAGREPRLVMPSDRDQKRMHRVIDGLVVHDVEGDLEASLVLAVQRLSQGGGARRIHVITDGALAKPVSLQAAIPVEIVRIGTPRDNVGIVRVDVRAAEDPVLRREQLQAFLLLANHGLSEREVFVTMRQRGASDTLASRRLVLPPGERSPVLLTFLPAPADHGTGLVFEVTPHDALEVDDVAYARVPKGRDLPVVLTAPGTPSPWLTRVLGSDPDAELKVGPLPSSLKSVPTDAFLVVENACPTNLPGGDVWIVNPPAGECFGVKVGALVDGPLITSWDEGDPRLRFLSLDELFVGKARVLEPASRRQTLVRTSLGPIACDASTPGRQITILGFDVAESDWPFRASFVIFVRNLLELARAHRSELGGGATTAGEALRVQVPLAVGAAEVFSLSNEGQPSVSVQARLGLLVVPDVQRVGFYRVAWTQPAVGELLVPVNLTSSAESDLRRPFAAAGAAVSVSGAHPASASSMEHAYWVALLALALVLFDIAWFTRRQRRASPRPAARGESRS